jgi:sialate O-acetylesterase
MKKYCFILFIVLCNQSFAQTQLPNFFSDHMILQQQTVASIWGKDQPNKKITVKASWGKSATGVVDAQGKWKLQLPTPSAGGPYQIEIKGSSTIILNDVLVGEVWFCSGQSNMEMPVKGNVNQPIIGSNEAIIHSTNNSIRFFNTPKVSSLTPLDNSNGNWKAANTETTGNFSAAAYFFARKLQSVLGIPIGIIQSAWGASTIESWMDQKSLIKFNTKPIPEKLPIVEPNRTPTILYNSMLHPYIGYTIKGVLWYQGEANRENAHEYHPMFSSMIQSWRTQWQQGDFPFYFVQIAPHEGGKTNAALLREAQLKTMLTEKNTGMAVTMDIGERNMIHPAQKEMVGNRLAYWALAKDYQLKGFAFSGPVYQSMQTTTDGKIEISFTYAEMGLSSFGKPLLGFEIAGEDKVFYPAKAVFTKDKNGRITVWNEEVKNPVSVRYGFTSWAEASIFNTQGLPASSFRTDNW